ncbi:MAG TPA: hypothetical protein VG267_04255, partial [Terracidiphilus sp.]|nr:hypothetical protein [Terracidiphilus sp.]
FSRTITGDLVMTNQRSFGELGNPRSAAKWKDALERLENHGLVRSMTHSGNVFEVTEAGYRMADYINLTQPMGA